MQRAVKYTGGLRQPREKKEGKKTKEGTRRPFREASGANSRPPPPQYRRHDLSRLTILTPANGSSDSLAGGDTIAGSRRAKYITVCRRHRVVDAVIGPAFRASPCGRASARPNLFGLRIHVD